MGQLRTSIFYRATKNLIEYRKALRATHRPTDIPDQDYPAYVINLDRSPERRDYILAHMESIGIKPTRISAFDGKKLSMDELIATKKYDDAVSRQSFDRSLSMAEIGCALSHLSIYQTMVRDQVAVALITEDDAQFSADARARIQHLINSAPPDWELIQLRFDCRDFDLAGPDLTDFRFKSALPVAATTYLMKLSAAQKIVANAFPVRYPADSLLGRANNWGVRIYGAWPEIVGVNNVFPSAIQGNRNWRFKTSNFIKQLILKVLR